MRNAAANWIGIAAALTCAVTARAHHSGSMYVPTATWIKGTVVRFDNIGPHSITTLEERAADGQVRRWAVEGPSAAQLDRLGLSAAAPAAGDVVEFCGFGYKSVEELSRTFPGTDFSARRPRAGTDASLAGHVMVSSDGAMRVWEPHGLLSECIRGSAERRPAWIAFLRSSPRAQQAWCEQREYAPVRSNAVLQAVVADLDGSIGSSCD